MNRLIEFRAWHTPTGRLFSVGGLTDSRVYYREETDPTLLLDLPREECVLMQRTQHTDRNGQPLFEGDIVRVDMVLCKADREEALEEEPHLDPEYSSYQCVAYHKDGFILVDVGENMTDPGYARFVNFWLHDFDSLSLHRVLAGNLYQHPEIAAQTGLFDLHPDHIREPHEV